MKERWVEGVEGNSRSPRSHDNHRHRLRPLTDTADTGRRNSVVKKVRDFRIVLTCLV